MKHYTFLEREQELELLRRYRKLGDRGACDILIDSQTPLARKLIHKRLRRRGDLEAEHMVAEAALCVYDAINRFDLERGSRLSTVVGWAVLQRTERRFNGGPIYLPPVADKTAPEAYERVLTARTLDGRRYEDDDRDSLSDQLIYSDEYLMEFDEREAAEREQAAVLDAVEQLPPRQRAVIEGRFFHNKTLKQVGEELGVTKERIRQMEAMAKGAVRDILDPEHKIIRKQRHLRMPEEGTVTRAVYEWLLKHGPADAGVVGKAFNRTSSAICGMIVPYKGSCFEKTEDGWAAILPD